MKTIKFLTTAILCFFALSAAAQGHQKQDFTISVGLGVGSVIYSGLSFNANAEYAITDEISIGASIGYINYTDDYYYSILDYYDYKVSAFYFGPRGTYHFSELLNINVEALDLYGGVFIGAAISTVKYAGVKVRDYSEVSPVAYNVFGGARYYFNPNFAVYGELGVGTTILQTGVSFKF